MEYRTQEQFERIQENAMNGNWSDAAELAELAAFYSKDLIECYENTECKLIKPTDLAIIAEMTQALR